MANYSFDNRATGELMTLWDVDKELCERTKAPVREREYCGLFHLAVEVGFAYLMRTSEGSIPENADLSVAFKPGAWDTSIPENVKRDLEWVFNTYIFRGWR